jgi:hypothetical protein
MGNNCWNLLDIYIIYHLVVPGSILGYISAGVNSASTGPKGVICGCSGVVF